MARRAAAGGVLLDLTELDAIEWRKPGVLRVGAGAKMVDIDTALKGHGWELRMHPSTKRTATIGGFVAVTAFLTYYLIKVVPFWGMALIGTSVIFLGPLIYIENKNSSTDNLSMPDTLLANKPAKSKI